MRRISTIQIWVEPLSTEKKPFPPMRLQVHRRRAEGALLVLGATSYTVWNSPMPESDLVDGPDSPLSFTLDYVPLETDIRIRVFERPKQEELTSDVLVKKEE